MSPKTPTEKAVDTAAALIKKTAEDTAMALNVQYIQRDILEIKQSIKDMLSKDDNFVHKDEFVFWRNILVSGMLLTVALGVIVNAVR